MFVELQDYALAKRHAFFGPGEMALRIFCLSPEPAPVRTGAAGMNNKDNRQKFCGSSHGTYYAGHV